MSLDCGHRLGSRGNEASLKPQALLRTPRGERAEGPGKTRTAFGPRPGAAKGSPAAAGGSAWLLRCHCNSRGLRSGPSAGDRLLLRDLPS